MISIRRRLTRNLLIATLTLGGAGFLALFFAARDSVIEQFDAALQAKALAISELTEPAPDGNGVQVRFSDHFFRGFDERHSRDFFEIWDAAGHPLARSDSLGTGDLPRRSDLEARLRRWNLVLPTGHPGRALGFLFQPKAASAARAAPTIQLTVASDRTGLDETLWQCLALASVSAGVLLAVAFWLIPRVLRRGLQPLEEMGDRVASVDAGSLGTRFRTDALPRELAPIAGRLNELLSRIQQSFERERRFTADLAHELRTPLAELRSMAECAIKWPESRDPATDRDALAIAEQMEAMVEHMLALARGEQRQLGGKRTKVALDQMVREHLAKVAGRAATRGLRVATDLPRAEVEADPLLLRAIISNLLENAVDYATEGGAVELAIEDRADRVSLRVANATAELEPADLPRLFERFWRKEAARSGGQHVGLGLSLARTFAEAMGATLTAELGKTAWLELTLSWSRARDVT